MGAVTGCGWATANSPSSHTTRRINTKSLQVLRAIALNRRNSEAAESGIASHRGLALSNPTGGSGTRFSTSPTTLHPSAKLGQNHNFTQQPALVKCGAVAVVDATAGSSMLGSWLRRDEQQQQQQPTVEQKRLDKRVWQASTTEELFGLISSSAARFSHATMANALTKLSQLLRRMPAASRAAVRRHPALPRLLAGIEEHVAVYQPRDICAVLQACAWLQLAAPGRLLDSLACQLAQQAVTAEPLTLVQSLWALAKLGFRSERLLVAVEQLALAAAAGGECGAEPGAVDRQPWLGQLPPSSLVLLLWSCAKLGHRSELLLEGLAAALAAGGRLAQLSAGELSVVLYACGSLGWHPGPLLMAQLARLLPCRVGELTPQGLANAAWGLAKVGHADAALMATIAQVAAPRAAEFRMHELAVLLSAYSGLRLQEQGLLVAAGHQLERRAVECSPRDLADLLSSMASLGHSPTPDALAAAAARGAALAPRFPPVWLSWLLWAFARLGHPPTPLLAAVERLWLSDSLRLHQFAPVDLGRLCWALAKLQHYSGRLLGTLALAVRDAAPAMPPRSLATCLHAFARQGYTPHEALDAAAEHVATRLHEYPPQAAAMVAWAFARMGVHPGRGLPGGGPTAAGGAPLMRALAAAAAARMDEWSVQGLSMLLWSFATLEEAAPTALLHAVSLRVCAELAALRRHSPQHGNQHSQRTRVSLQAAAVVAWSFARLRHDDPQLLAAIGAAMPTLVADALAAATAQAGAAAALGTVDEEGACGEDMSERGIAQAVANLAYAAAKQGVRDDALLRALEGAAAPRIHLFLPEELCNLLWACATLSHPLPAPLLAAACERLEATLADCDPGLVCLAVHALAVLRHRAGASMLRAAVAHVASVGEDTLAPGLLCKLLWGCAAVGYTPPAEHVQAICDTLHYRLSHARARTTVLPASDTVMLAWALALLQQYHTPLYRNVAFRTSRLPDGIPSQQAHVSLLQQVALLSNVDGAPAADTVLPDWLQAAGAAASRAVPEQWAAAEELRDALLAAGQKGAVVKRLAYGECVVMLPVGRGKQAALLPWWEGSRAANTPGQVVGSTLVAQRVLAATGMRVVAASNVVEETVQACASLA